MFRHTSIKRSKSEAVKKWVKTKRVLKKLVRTKRVMKKLVRTNRLMKKFLETTGVIMKRLVGTKRVMKKDVTAKRLKKDLVESQTTGLKSGEEIGESQRSEEETEENRRSYGEIGESQRIEEETGENKGSYGEVGESQRSYGEVGESQRSDEETGESQKSCGEVLGEIQKGDEGTDQNETSAEETTQIRKSYYPKSDSDDDINSNAEGPRCIVSDPAQPHQVNLRNGAQIKYDCFSCGNKDISWPAHRFDKFHYYCTICDLEFHERCHDFPSKMIHPYHPEHPLTFTFLSNETGIIVDTNYGEFYKALSSVNTDLKFVQYLETTKPNSSIIFDKCTWCRKDLREWFYRCSICNFSLDIHCAQDIPPLTIQNPNSHHHSLILFPRPLSFPCYACGLINMLEPSYACYQCSYFVHQSCIDLPRVIKLTRHPHRLSHTPYLPTKVSTCRVCYKSVDIKHGQYSCNHGDCTYIVHSKCATRKKVWDGGELEWEPEEPDEAEDIAPYKKVGGNLIEHFWHSHHYLKLEEYNHAKDSTKQCQACMRYISSSDFYSCIECDFFLHEVCANLPKKLNHALHNHSLSMDSDRKYYREYSWYSQCFICGRQSSGLMYRCPDGERFQIDINCILILECFTHESHAEHPLFISTPYSDESKFFCQGCKCEVGGYHLQCTLCDFALCYKCATIPHEIYHKYDEDPLFLCYGESGVDDSSNLYWCEVCEKRLDPTEWFYTDNRSCVTIHCACLFGDNVYMKAGQTFEYRLGDAYELEVFDNGSCSRPTCYHCQDRCPNPIYYHVTMWNHDRSDFDPNGIQMCSVDCLEHIPY